MGCEVQVRIGGRGRQGEENFLFSGCADCNYIWQDVACRAGMHREMRFVAENVGELVVFSGLRKLPDKHKLEPCSKVLFLLEPFPLQRLERIQPLKSQMIKLGTVQSLNL